MRVVPPARPAWLALIALVAAGPASGVEPQRREILSPVHFVDMEYKSMQGPMSSQRIFLSDAPEPELMWLVGFGTEMVAADGKTSESQEFLCHTNLELDPSVHDAALALPTRNFSSRLFTNTQGQQEVRFPDGFGIPVASNEPLVADGQVVNLSRPLNQLPLKVRHRIWVDYIPERELKTPMKPLYQATAMVLVSMEGKETWLGVQEPDEHQQGSSCLPAEAAGGGMGRKAFMHDSLGQKFTGHWVIGPGRQTYRTLVTELLDLKFDTTIHFAGVHVHAFAESVELRDLTDGRTILRTQARSTEDRIGLAHIDTISSPEGIPVYKDHDYELVVVYDNTSGAQQDSMAVLFLYLLDKEFRRDAIAGDRG